MYTGCDYDAETSLTYHWNRWRSEDGSAFISEDPARDGANWYGYAGQNPMVYVDPTGLAPYINGVYDGPYNPDYNPGVPVEGPKTNPSGMPQNQTPNIPATPNHVAGFSEQYGNYNVLPKYKGIETGDKWYNSLFEGIVNYGIIGTYNLCATAINTISNGVGAAYDLINAASETVLGGDLDAITMTMMSNGMLAPAGYMLNGFNSYMNGLKLSNTSRIRNVALSTIQTSVNVGAGLVNVDSASSSASKFYVAPNGDCLPAIGYRYMDSRFADQIMTSMSAPGSYICFEKFNSSSEAIKALQINPVEFRNNCRLRGQFDTLQIFDDTFVPTMFGNKAGYPLEPYTKSYPMLGNGGYQQYIHSGTIKFDEITILEK